MEFETETISCIHPVIYNGMCAECGKYVSPDFRYQKTQDIYILSTEIRPSKIERFLFNHKKLALIVDLDKTLIDTTCILNEHESEKIIALNEKNKSNLFYFKTNETFLVKLRPFLNEFLEKISQFYFMQLYTLSERSYAMQIIKKIDPEGKFFNQRILTRENSSKYKKSISDFFLTGQNMAVVIDDTRRVWRNEDGTTLPNLVQVKPFNYFPKVTNPRKIANKLDFISHNIKKSDENDNYLKRMATVLTEIHSKFYKLRSPNVPDIINEMKKSVFKECYIYFCSIWSDDNLAQKKLYVDDATSNGARVLKKFKPYVTHIVTTNPIHEDVVEAKKYKGIFILNYKWFVNSIFCFEKQPELDPIYIVSNHSGSAPQLTDGTEKRTDPPNPENISEFENFEK